MKLALAELQVAVTQAWNLTIWMVVVCIGSQWGNVSKLWKCWKYCNIAGYKGHHSGAVGVKMITGLLLLTLVTMGYGNWFVSVSVCLSDCLLPCFLPVCVQSKSKIVISTGFKLVQAMDASDVTMEGKYWVMQWLKTVYTIHNQSQTLSARSRFHYKECGPAWFCCTSALFHLCVCHHYHYQQIINTIERLLFPGWVILSSSSLCSVLVCSVGL